MNIFLSWKIECMRERERERERERQREETKKRSGF